MGQGFISLQAVMNKMAAHLDDILPAEISLPQDREWPMIEAYLGIDAVLASLYKQYCDARMQLEQLVRSGLSHEPMAEIVADMKDSLHSAVSTRLIELRDDDSAQRAMALAKPAIAVKRAKPVETFDQMMAFMLWTRLMLKQSGQARSMRGEFRHAA